MWCLSSHFDYIIMYSYVPNSIEYLFFWVRVLCNPGWSGTLYDLSLTLNFWSFSLYQVSAGHIGMSFYTQLRQWLKIKPTCCAWEASAILVELHSQCSNNIGYYYSLYVGGLGKFLISNISKYFFSEPNSTKQKAVRVEDVQSPFYWATAPSFSFIFRGVLCSSDCLEVLYVAKNGLEHLILTRLLILTCLLFSSGLPET